MQRRRWFPVAVAALASVSALRAGAQANVGVVRGTVIGAAPDAASPRTPLGHVMVALFDSAARFRAPSVETSDSGTFQLSGLRAGRTTLVAMRIGYRAETLTVVVSSTAAAHADFVMHAIAVRLEADVIEADPLRGKMGAFNRRKARGIGAFVTRADIDTRHPQTMSELLRYVPGVGVLQKMAGEPQPVRMQRSAGTSLSAACSVLLYVDGHPYQNGSVDDFRPTAIEGVEVYRSASEVPAEFRTRDATCGLIVLWTRDPEATARRAP